jgi:hypothetical protein
LFFLMLSRRGRAMRAFVAGMDAQFAAISSFVGLSTGS